MSRVHPLDYVAFSEAGKWWGFRFETLWRWICRSARPINPYTNVPLQSETTIRLRRLWRYKKPVGSIPRVISLDERMQLRINIVAQLLHDNGFEDVSPSLFLNLKRSDWIVFFRFVRDDLEVVVPTSYRAIARRYLGSIDDLAAMLPSAQFRDQASRLLFTMLMDPTDPYILAYTVMAALHKL